SAVVGVALQPGLAEMTPEERRVVLHTLKPAYADIIHLSSFDVNGIDVADSDDITRPPATQRLVFVEPRRTGEAALDVFIGPTTGTPVFAFGAPVKDRNGQFAGIVGASLQAARVSQLLESAMGGAGTQAYVIDSQARVVAHPDPSLPAALADFSEAPAVVAMRDDDDGRGALRYDSP